jgi:serine/threonine protein kinase
MSFIIPKTRAKTVYKNKDCVKYEKGKQMGDPSVYGTVFDTCCGGEKLAKGGLGLRKDCHNITKIVNFKKIKDKSATESHVFIDEITAQQIAYRHGIAPAIQKAYVSDENGVVIMDKMAMTFDQYVDEWVDDYIDYIKDENDSGYSDEHNHNKLVKKAVELARMIDDFHHRLHDLGIYHRDMKGDNVMIDRNGHWKVIDFGVAAIVDKFDVNNYFKNEYRMIKDSREMFINGQPDSPEKEFYKEFVKELTRLRDLESDRLKKLNKEGVKPNLHA